MEYDTDIIQDADAGIDFDEYFFGSELENDPSIPELTIHL